MNAQEYESVRQTAARHHMDMSEYTRLMVSVEAWTEAMLAKPRELHEGLPEVPYGAQMSAETEWEEFRLRAAIVGEALDAVNRMEAVAQQVRQLFVPTLQGLMEILQSLPGPEERRDG
jgi:hypothetical protein